MIPQRYIARVQEVKALMRKTSRPKWRLILAESLNAEMAADGVAGKDWADVQEAAIEYTLRETGIGLEPSELHPF